ncbi:MAG: LytTR family transcriptional regulator [Chitinophagaceae bacterium]|nr:LytTR family transcriptional regulator [Chitinophagaceae bacterium]
MTETGIICTSGRDNGNHMLITTNCGAEIIDISTIIRIEALSNYSKLFFVNGKTLVVAKVLRWFEEGLSAEIFIRTHRTHLVNKQFIHAYRHGNGAQVKLVNGESINVSKRKKKFLLQSLCALTV